MKSKYSKSFLLDIVNKSETWSEVCSFIGITKKGGNQTHIKNVCKFYDIDYSHFLGSSHRGIKRKKWCANKIDASEYFFKGSTISSHTLKNHLIRDGYKKSECEICGISEWRGEPVVLELDHINSDHTDNRFENLQILCPNCHRLETRKRRKTRSENSEKKKYYCDCGKEKSRQSFKCQNCRDTVPKRKITISPEELKILVFKKPFTKLSKELNVSDSALIRFCKKNNISTPPRGHWSRNHYD